MQSVEGGLGLVGEFESESGARYLMVVNKDFIDAVTLLVTLRSAPSHLQEVSKQTGTQMMAAGYSPSTGEITVQLASGDGRLFRLGE
ncbi:MAG: hypothetical protein HOM68_09320 [Gemmatimonadetes bacterium]|nr:hypothetical protein [Gemmatimonadota bacterium]MBT5056728.1 hypothetical protein [Gemmatimonadota bacterium]MBT5145675.1 hypothetical protein [Gemmatimonadota bacterium]MBT5588095.1 hypothetical protein [Gemmatimonadota bacterium]MBT5960739.1 hypothetical protein [Gemmatimonadota bacterium]